MEGESFILRNRWYSHTCRPLEITGSVHRVTPTGQVTQISSQVVQSEPEACVSN